MRRSAVWFVVFIALVLSRANPALAHASLERSDPPASATLMQPPEAIHLWFTEPLEPEFSSIRLLDAGGAVVQAPASEVSAIDPRQMTLHPGALSEGVYTVDWRVLSAYDGHPTQGSFAFSIGVTLEGATTAGVSETTVPLQNAAIRWLNLVSFALLFGGVGFWLLVWDACGFGFVQAAERRMKRVVWLGWLLTGLSSVLILLMQVAAAANIPLVAALSSPALPDMIANTRFGGLWLARVALWLAVAAALIFAGRSRRWLWLAFALGALLLLTASLFSHATIAADAMPAVAGDWLHLTMTALWLGGLVQLFTVLGVARQVHSAASLPEQRLVLHFSNFARVAVAGLIVTGLYAAWLQVGSLDALTSTLYGQALLVKLLLFAPLLVIAGVNLMWTARGLREGQIVWARRLRGLVGIEVALMIGILAAVGVMTSISPSRVAVAARAAEAAAPAGFFNMQVVDDLHVHLAITPATVGSNAFVIELYDDANRRVTDASLVRLRFENRRQNVGLSGLALEPQADGTYTATGTNLSLPGQWRVRTTIQRPDKFDAVVDFNVPIVASPTPAPAPDTTAPLPGRTLALLLTGLLALIAGGYFAARERVSLWRGAGLLASGVVLVGVLFLVSGALTL